MQPAEPATDRAKRRRDTWPVTVRRLREPVEPVAFGTPETRLQAVAELTEQCWRLAGKPLPSYARHETPVRITRMHPPNDAAS
jgi:hypothetical protein